MVTSNHFQESEFKKCIPSCSLQDMNQEFMNKLDLLREKAGIPIVINCAYRSREWDVAKGRSGTGDHPQGKAVDIRCYNSSTRFKVLKAAIEVGFRRIGVEGSFIHVGMGENLSQDTVWVY